MKCQKLCKTEPLIHTDSDVVVFWVPILLQGLSCAAFAPCPPARMCRIFLGRLAGCEACRCAPSPHDRCDGSCSCKRSFEQQQVPHNFELDWCFVVWHHVLPVADSSSCTSHSGGCCSRSTLCGTTAAHFDRFELLSPDGGRPREWPGQRSRSFATEPRIPRHWCSVERNRAFSVTRVFRPHPW